MGRWQDVIHSFNAGEFSPRMRGRTDISKYQSAADTLKNFIVTIEGTAVRRSGTRFVSEVSESSDSTRLVPFIYSTTQAYVLEFGAGYFRVYRNEALVVYGELWTPTDPGLVGTPLVVSTPYAAEDVFGLRFAQTADTLYVAHAKYPVHKVARQRDDLWSNTEIFFEDGPYLPVNREGTLMSPHQVGGTDCIVTADQEYGINNDRGFLDDDTHSDVGRSIRLGHDVGSGELPKWGWGYIASVGSVSGGYALAHYTAGAVDGNGLMLSAKVNVRGVFADAGAGFSNGDTEQWHLGAWHGREGTAGANYPQVVTLAEQRLVLCGEPNTPQTLHASVSGSFENFAGTGEYTYPADPSVQDDNALNFELGTDQVNDIRYAKVQQSLLLGTSHGIFPVQAGSAREAVTPTNINVPEATLSGAARIGAIKAGNAILYIGRDGRHLRKLHFSFDVDTFVSEDLTRLATHVLDRGAVEMDYAQESDSTVLVVTQEGRLATMAHAPEEQVWGWSRQVIGGSFANDIARVKSVAVIPSQDESHDQIWLIVERTINGQTKQYVEFIEEPFRQANPSQAKEKAFFVDSGLSLDGFNSETDPIDITDITQADPVVVKTLSGHNYTDGHHIRIRDVVGMTELNGSIFEVAGATERTFQLNTLDGATIDGTGFTAYASGGQTRRTGTTISGLSHIAGETVDILGDGAPQPQQVVSLGGTVTLAQEAAEVSIGLPYTSDLKTLKIVPSTRSGAHEMRLKRIDRVFVRLLDTVGGSVGPEADTLDPIILRDPDDSLTQALEPFTGDVELTFEDSWERGVEVFVRQDQPLPMTVLAMVTYGEFGDI